MLAIPPPVTPVAMTAMTTDSSLYRLMTWLSPAFPVGGYSYSHGIETAVDEGRIAGAEHLQTWIEGILAFGALHVDAVLLREAWEAVTAEDVGAFTRTAERAETLRATAELGLESAAQGRAFLDTVRATSPDPRLDRWAQVMAEAEREPAYSVAVGLVAAVAAIPTRSTLIAYVHAGVANLVSAGVRHIPLGQTQGQTIMANLESTVAETVEAALNTAPEDLGAAAVMVDWCSARHETQRVRLFRS